MITAVRSARTTLPAAAALAWVVAQICYPLTVGAARDRVTVAVVLLSVTIALTHALAERGPRYAVGYLLIVAGIGFAAEMIGTASGFPFGCYVYAEGRLGPAVAEVPLVIPLAWAGGLYPVWVVTGLLFRRAYVRIAMTAVGAVGWDLFLDPQMVADRQWSWCSDLPGLPGISEIPYTNFLGWLAVASLMAVLLHLLEHAQPARGASPVVPVAVFLWTWLGSTFAHAVFLGLPASAGYGFVGLGVLGIPSLAWIGRRARRVRLRSACHGTM
ncbi:carotenoid biosynthesis protein [Nocardia sp. CDC159]|uniref:Carotenoid biosynthesis protein n=1 Tax=Nocardia pulmonis TaxID=2951408 RepID=A0A9X2IUZ0_9NOCA|nr:MULTISPECIES: carotenoid biosynthesis protein [Nocardia]MCM6773347.1 carotenoid biosynthesis protein [Nocardia pulmonis]MCM6786234.1 carotenoid biosynthesis protein [Nocardia sp. CDC159]